MTANQKSNLATLDSFIHDVAERKSVATKELETVSSEFQKLHADARKLQHDGRNEEARALLAKAALMSSKIDSAKQAVKLLEEERQSIVSGRHPGFITATTAEGQAHRDERMKEYKEALADFSRRTDQDFLESARRVVHLSTGMLLPVPGIAQAVVHAVNAHRG